MKYLLDVTALMAWSHPTAAEHSRFHSWAKTAGFDALATCAHVELGFILGFQQSCCQSCCQFRLFSGSKKPLFPKEERLMKLVPKGGLEPPCG